MNVERCTQCNKLIDALAGFIVVVDSSPQAGQRMELLTSQYCAPECLLAGYSR